MHGVCYRWVWSHIGAGIIVERRDVLEPHAYAVAELACASLHRQQADRVRVDWVFFNIFLQPMRYKLTGNFRAMLEGQVQSFQRSALGDATRANGAVPWGDRVWPYCISVRDCYEKALGALCGKHNPRQPLSECFAALTKADFCTDAAKPYPCPNGCQASFEDCARRGKKEEAFVQRNL